MVAQVRGRKVQRSITPGNVHDLTPYLERLDRQITM